VGARVLATTRAQSVLMSPPPDADDVRALREIVIDLARLPDANRCLTGLMSGSDLRYDLGDSDPLVGARMIDLSLETDNGRPRSARYRGPDAGCSWNLAGPTVPDVDARRCRPGSSRGLSIRPSALNWAHHQVPTACWSDPTATSAGQALARAHHPSSRCGDGSAPHRSDRPDPPRSSTPPDLLS
jgi:hypothetical protein